jgi:hypothetical protein
MDRRATLVLKETPVLEELQDRKAMLGLLDRKVRKAFKNPMGLLTAKG